MGELADTTHIDDLKSKVQTLNTSIQAALETGALTANEQPEVLDELTVRLHKAKSEGKAKLQEKLERQIVAVKASAEKPVPVPLPDVQELDALTSNLREKEQKRLDAIR